MSPADVRKPEAVVLLVGQPGCGKSTQGSKIAEQHPNVTHISVGELIRQFRSHNGFVPKSHSRGLATTAFTMRLINAEIARRGNQILIIDGFPREVSQVSGLPLLAAPVQLVVKLDVPYEVSLSRMVNRERDGESVAVIGERLHYHCKREACVEQCLKAYGVNMVTVDGNRPMATVTADLVAAIRAGITVGLE